MAEKINKEEPIVQKGLVVTSNDLTLAKYNFTLWQKRVFNYFVSQIDKDAKEFNTQRVYITDLLRFYKAGDSQEAYNIILNVPKQLFDLSIKIRYQTEKGQQRYGEVRIITKYTKPEDKDPDNAYIEFKFNDDLKPHLLELKSRFAKYDLYNIVGLQSTYSIRIFEILKSFQYLHEVTFEVEDLKAILDITDKYKLYADFKRYVVDKALEDLSKNCDITFTYQEIKQGRKVHALRFEIRSNTLVVPTLKLPESIVSSSVTERVGERTMPITVNLEAEFSEVSQLWHVNRTQFLKKTAGKMPEDVRQAILFTKEKVRLGGVKNPAGVFLSALTKGEKTFRQIKEEQQQLRKQEKQERNQRIAQLIESYEILKEEHTHNVNNLVRLIVEHDPSVTQRAIDEVTAVYAEKGQKAVVAGKTIEDFRQDPTLRAAVIEVIKRQHQPKFDPQDADFERKKAKIQQELKAIEPDAVKKLKG
jgi:plasmid replication initiation protein